jgi:AraC-like DNA-binding protein
MRQNPHFLRNRPENHATMDPLSDVLALLKPQFYMLRGLDAGGDWCLNFAPDEGVKCYALTHGACWLSIDGQPAPLRFASGDCVLLPSGRAFRMASNLAAPAIDAGAFFTATPKGGIATLNGGGDCSGTGGYFEFAGRHAEILLSALPPVVHVRNPAANSAIRWCVDCMMQELRDPKPGSDLVGEHLTQLLLVQALRLHIQAIQSASTGWLAALADKSLRAAISAMHEDPAHRWTLESLAKTAGMSRSTFALKFKQTVGSPAMDYLTTWRMHKAASRLAQTREPVSAIARSLGYDSESAFSTAFKRVMHHSPRRFARGDTDAKEPLRPSDAKQESASF